MTEQATDQAPPVIPANAALLRHIAEDFARGNFVSVVGGEAVAARLHALADVVEKVTREDVDALRYARSFAENPASLIEGAIDVDREGTGRLQALARTIAKLLPPE